MKQICRDAQEKFHSASEPPLEAAVTNSVNSDDDDNMHSPTDELFNPAWSDDEDNVRHVDDIGQDGDDDEMDDLYVYMFTQRDLVSKGNQNICEKTSIENEHDVTPSISCTNFGLGNESDAGSEVDERKIGKTNSIKPVQGSTAESDSDFHTCNDDVINPQTNTEAIADNMIKSGQVLSSVGSLMMSTSRDEKYNVPCVPKKLTSCNESQQNIYKDINFTPDSFEKNDDTFDQIISGNESTIDHYHINNDSKVVDKDEALDDRSRAKPIADISIMFHNEADSAEDDIVSLVTEDDMALFLSESEDCLDDDATIKPEEPSTKNYPDDIGDQTTPIIAIPVGYVDGKDGIFHRYDGTNDEYCEEESDEDDGSWLVPATPVDKTLKKSSIIKTAGTDEKQDLYDDKFKATLTNSINKTNTEPMIEDKNSFLILVDDDEVSFSLKNIEDSLVPSQIEKQQEMPRNLHNSKAMSNLVERKILNSKTESNSELRKTRLSLEQEYNLIDCSVSLSPLPQKVVESRKLTVSTPICGSLDTRSCIMRASLQLSPVSTSDSLCKERDVEIIGDNFYEIDNECNSHSPVFGNKQRISETIFTCKDRDKKFSQKIKFDADGKDRNGSNKKRKLDNLETETSPFQKKKNGSTKYKFKKPRKLTPESQTVEQVVLPNNENKFCTDADMNINAIEKRSRCDGHDMTLIVDKSDINDMPTADKNKPDELDIPNTSSPINRLSSEFIPEVLGSNFLPISGASPFLSELCKDVENDMKLCSDEDGENIPARDIEPANTNNGVIVYHLSGTCGGQVTIEGRSSPVDIQLDDFRNLDDPSDKQDLSPEYSKYARFIYRMLFIWTSFHENLQFRQ